MTTPLPSTGQAICLDTLMADYRHPVRPDARYAAGAAQRPSTSRDANDFPSGKQQRPGWRPGSTLAARPELKIKLERRFGHALTTQSPAHPNPWSGGARAPLA